MLCPECGARGYSRKTKTPEWRCSKCGHEWDVAPDNPPPIDLLGLTPIALTPNTPRLATLRLLNLIASVVVFAVTAVGLFFLQLLAIVPLQPLAGWYEWQRPVGEGAHPMFYVVTSLKIVLILGLALFVASRVHADLGRRIDPSD